MLALYAPFLPRILFCFAGPSPVCARSSPVPFAMKKNTHDTLPVLPSGREVPFSYPHVSLALSSLRVEAEGSRDIGIQNRSLYKFTEIIPMIATGMVMTRD